MDRFAAAIENDQRVKRVPIYLAASLDEQSRPTIAYLPICIINVEHLIDLICKCCDKILLAVNIYYFV